MPDELPQVPRFQDLYVRQGAARFDELMGEIDRRTTPPWRRDPEYRPVIDTGGQDAKFDRVVADGTGCRLFLRTVDADLSVTNIVPEGAGIGPDQYNRLLNEFEERVLRPAALALGLRVEGTAPVIDIVEELGPDASTRLLDFTALANKATGSAHPRDQERWFAFLVAAESAPGRIEPDELNQWLQLDGWSPAVAGELAGEYEFGIALLAFRRRHS